ncbi:hypothetical protein [Ureaplasma ceti]|uniref:Uncharacterized protein n=1 Tax=Ureaplasma ceti TaxID=3119530 RepID=A0ABP9UCI5_9BACT
MTSERAKKPPVVWTNALDNLFDNFWLDLHLHFVRQNDFWQTCEDLYQYLHKEWIDFLTQALQRLDVTDIEGHVDAILLRVIEYFKL